jgi:NAD(P)-dependent dehydrogenase (short-subunit alcohol dehydrogenase family)
MRLEGKVAFITGAGGGIGRAAAMQFSQAGAAVAIAEKNESSGSAAADEIRAAGGVAEFIATDVTADKSVRAAVARASAALGPVTVLFNCAGGSLEEDSYVTDVDIEVWSRTMDVDLKGTFLCCRHAIPEMIKTGRGSIINMSSGAALRGSSPSHAYTAAKGAILSLTRALAGRYARDNIRANAICSGRVLTKRIVSRYGKPGRPGPVADRQKADERVKEYPFWVGEPEDIAAIALFLASDESRMITGAAIPADGGRSAY